MPRYDRFKDDTGGFRAALAAAWSSSDVGKIFGVSINSSGKVVKGGADAAAICGVVIVTEAKIIGDIVDVMTAGQIADFITLADGSTATIAGTKYYAIPGTGVLTATATSNKLVGTLLEKDGRDRFIVRVAML